MTTPRRPRFAPTAGLLAALVVTACGDQVTSNVPDGQLAPEELWRQLDAAPVDFFGVSGSSAEDVLLVGGQGTILRWNGIALLAEPSNTTEDLHGVWAVSPTLAYAVGANGARLRWDGAVWTPATTTVDSTGATVTITAQLQAVWANETRAFAVGANGTALRCEGGLWTLLPADSPDDLFAVLGVGDEVIAVGTLGTVARFDGTAFHRSAIWGFSRTLAALGTGPGGTWAAGLDGALFAYDGSSFDEVEGMPLAFLRGVSAPGDVYIVGWDATLVRIQDGEPLVYEHLPDRWLNGVWAASNDDVWVVGASGLVLRGPPMPVDAGPQQAVDGGTP